MEEQIRMNKEEPQQLKGNRLRSNAMKAVAKRRNAQFLWC